MSNYKTISIVTPSFNQVKFISATLGSILSQAGDFYIDLIIMDGGSTDGSVDVVRKYEKLLQDNCSIKEQNGLKFYTAKDKSFEFNQCLGISYRWTTGKDKGQSDALNKGFKLAKGELTAWLNTDDVYLKDTLAKVFEFFRTHDQARVVFGGTVGVDAHDKPMFAHQPPDVTVYRLMFIKEGVPQPSVFFTRELLEEVGYVDLDLHYTMDTDLWYKFLFAEAEFYKLDDVLSQQTYHPDSKSSEGEFMFARMIPENKLLRRRYGQKLGITYYYWWLKRSSYNAYKSLVRFLRIGKIYRRLQLYKRYSKDWIKWSSGWNPSRRGVQLETAVLLITFNRPASTAKVLDAIRKVKPKHLYIANDGPRPGRDDDIIKSAQVRDLAKEVDWPCEVHTQFRTENLGCGFGPAAAITWFMGEAGEGIILEDDCVPDTSFFWYCQEMLQHYRDEPRVMHISGDNYQFGRRRSKDSFYFSAFTDNWGWATWQRAWQHFDYNMTELDNFLSTGKITEYLPEPKTQQYWKAIFDDLRGGKRRDVWDAQWLFAVWNAGGVAIIPGVNLVTNIGFDSDATHTGAEMVVGNLPTGTMRFPLRYPTEIEINYAADEFKQKMMLATRTPGNLATRVVKRTAKKILPHKLLTKLKQIT